ncbi:MAG: phosphatidate cytidylyltransferase [Desulfomonile tiedjei]|nr:phosphatidate cytidylyltransferase [Desulfomonile tiedjei]
MLRTRIISAAVALAILVPLLVWGGVTGVALIVAVCSGVAFGELSRSLPGLQSRLSRWLTFILGLAVIGAFYALPYRAVPAVVVFFPLVVVALHLFLYNFIENTLDSASQMIFVAGYVAVPLGHALLLARLDLGIAWVFYVLVVICLGDAGAYFAGKHFGKHRLSPNVSPSKTVEGLAGGVAGNFAGMLVMKAMVPGLLAIEPLALVTLLLAAAGPVGDLIASALKRRLAIKDFGTFLPGHGGVMDRADSLILAFPVVFYFLMLSGYAVPR